MLSLTHLFLFVFLLLGISGTESLSQSNGFSLKSIATAISYAGEYSSQESVINGESIGRSGSTFNTINGLIENGDVVFGNGLKSLKGEIKFSKYEVGYGITGLIREIISLGFVGGLLYLLFFVLSVHTLPQGSHARVCLLAKVAPCPNSAPVTPEQ